MKLFAHFTCPLKHHLAPPKSHPLTPKKWPQKCFCYACVTKTRVTVVNQRLSTDKLHARNLSQVPLNASSPLRSTSLGARFRIYFIFTHDQNESVWDTWMEIQTERNHKRGLYVYIDDVTKNESLYSQYLSKHCPQCHGIRCIRGCYVLLHSPMFHESHMSSHWWNPGILENTRER